jgi:hypothetical protein
MTEAGNQLDDLNKRVAGMNALPSLQIATVLDPRFKNLKCFPRDMRDAVWTVLREKFDSFCRTQNTTDSVGESSVAASDDVSEPAKKKSKLVLSFTDSDDDDDDGEHSTDEFWRFTVTEVHG